MAGAQGSGSAAGHYYAVMALVLAVLAAAQGAQATSYQVGGATTQWNFPPNVTWYNDVWAKDIVFKVGDSLVFNYVAGTHDVYQLSTDAEFQACTLNPVKTWQSGNDVVPLTTAGTFYYVCGIVTHCPAGMKLKVVVNAATAPPTAPPKPAPIAAPKPAPVGAPKLPPAHSPAVAPGPTPTAPTASSGAGSGATPAPAPAPGTSRSPPALAQSITGLVLAAFVATLAVLI